MSTKKWEELEITDDFLFGKVMRNPELCKRTIEAIPVSYTHLDVYKRQGHRCAEEIFIFINGAGLYAWNNIFIAELINNVFNI